MDYESLYQDPRIIVYSPRIEIRGLPISLPDIAHYRELPIWLAKKRAPVDPACSKSERISLSLIRADWLDWVGTIKD